MDLHGNRDHHLGYAYARRIATLTVRHCAVMSIAAPSSKELRVRADRLHKRGSAAAATEIA